MPERDVEPEPDTGATDGNASKEEDGEEEKFRYAKTFQIGPNEIC